MDSPLLLIGSVALLFFLLSRDKNKAKGSETPEVPKEAPVTPPGSEQPGDVPVPVTEEETCVTLLVDRLNTFLSDPGNISSFSIKVIVAPRVKNRGFPEVAKCISEKADDRSLDCRPVFRAALKGGISAQEVAIIRKHASKLRARGLLAEADCLDSLATSAETIGVTTPFGQKLKTPEPSTSRKQEVL